MHIYDLMDGARLTELVRDRYINQITSPDGNYLLYNYTEQATYERVWTPETRQCRGLVTDTSGNVVCLPFAKFANVGEPGFPECELEALAARGDGYEVTDKLDGSMVAVWHDDMAGRWRCTTRGSFTSTQAQAAQAWLDAHNTWAAWPDPRERDALGRRFTFVGEWCAPDNRVVLRYEEPELRLIGVRAWDADGRTFDLAHHGVRSWGLELGLSVVPRITATVADLIARQSSDTGIEGWVLRWPDGFRVKVKTADYIRLHKALSGFGPKQVYEVLTSGDEGAWSAYMAGLPEEIRGDASYYADSMVAAIVERERALATTFEQIRKLLGESRKAFALGVAEYPPADRAVLFAMADGKPTSPILWKQLDIRALFAETEATIATDE